jgi:hypothetical protein
VWILMMNVRNKRSNMMNIWCQSEEAGMLSTQKTAIIRREIKWNHKKCLIKTREEVNKMDSKSKKNANGKQSWNMVDVNPDIPITMLNMNVLNKLFLKVIIRVSHKRLKHVDYQSLFTFKDWDWKDVPFAPADPHSRNQ